MCVRVGVPPSLLCLSCDLPTRSKLWIAAYPSAGHQPPSGLWSTKECYHGREYRSRLEAMPMPHASVPHGSCMRGSLRHEGCTKGMRQSTQTSATAQSDAGSCFCSTAASTRTIISWNRSRMDHVWKVMEGPVRSSKDHINQNVRRSSNRAKLILPGCAKRLYDLLEP